MLNQEKRKEKKRQKNIKHIRQIENSKIVDLSTNL